MYTLTQNELQILDGLNTSESVLVAIQELACDRFVKDGELDKHGLAYSFWDDPLGCPRDKRSFDLCIENVLERAWELEDEDQIHWCEYSESA